MVKIVFKYEGIMKIYFFFLKIYVGLFSKGELWMWEKLLVLFICLYMLKYIN